LNVYPYWVQLAVKLNDVGEVAAHLIVASSFFPGHQLPAAIMLSFPGFTKSFEVRYAGIDGNEGIPALKKATTP
jgi:hypothetical protein